MVLIDGGEDDMSIDWNIELVQTIVSTDPRSIAIEVEILMYIRRNGSIR